MFYTIYKVTNNLNNKTYIGKHQTKDLQDGYMGSGKLIKAAIKKYGLVNFTKEILHVFATEEEMNTKEKELVVLGEQSYNLCEGGKGGFGYINDHKLNVYTNHGKRSIKVMREVIKHRRLTDPVYDEKYSMSLKKSARKSIEIQRNNGTLGKSFLGKHHSIESKQKIGLMNQIHQQGSKNSQYGTMWITNGTESKKVKKDLDFLPKGWYKGRVI